jgi:hypothetical protein
MESVPKWAATPRQELEYLALLLTMRIGTATEHDLSRQALSNGYEGCGEAYSS